MGLKFAQRASWRVDFVNASGGALLVLRNTVLKSLRNAQGALKPEYEPLSIFPGSTKPNPNQTTFNAVPVRLRARTSSPFVSICIIYSKNVAGAASAEE